MRPGRAPRPQAGLGALLVCLGALTACSSSAEDYCTLYAEKQAELNKIADQAAEDGVDQLTPTLAIYQDLRAGAPTGLTDEYDTVIFAYRDLLDAVEKMGVAPEDFRAGEAPPGLSKQKATALARVADKLTSIRVLEAAAGIEDYGSQVCDDAKK